MTKPSDTDWRKERFRITIFHIACILAGLALIFFLADGFNNIPVK